MGALRVGQLYTEITLEDSKFKAGLTRAHTDFQHFGSDLLGKAAGLAAGLGLAMGAADIIKKIGDIGISFQDMGNTFRAVTGATSAQMAEMSKRAIDLGNDLSLPSTSATDAESAMVELAKGGLSVSDAFAAAKGTLQLATAAEVDTGQAAVYTADALNTFHLAGKQAGMVADLLAGAANASSGEITDMALSLQQAGSVFAAAHVPIQDVVTLISEMAQNGIRGSDAGTSLKTMMMALQTQTDKQKALTKELNIHLYDSQGRMRDFRDIIKDAQGPLSKLTQAQRDNALGVIFGSDAVRSANVIFGEGTAGFDAMRTAVTKQGVAADVAAAKSQGLGGAIRGLQSQLETLGLQIFQKVEPSLTSLAKSLSNTMPIAVDAISKALDFIGVKAGEFAKVLGPIWQEYQKNVSEAVRSSAPQFKQIQQAFSDLGTQMQNLVKSEGFASVVAAFTVLVPAAIKPTMAGLVLMVDQFRVTATALIGLAKVAWDVSQGDWKAAWKDATDTVQTESENQQRLVKDTATFNAAVAGAMSDDVTREYNRMRDQTLVAMNGIKQDDATVAEQTRIQMAQAAVQTSGAFTGGMADGLRTGGTQIADAAGNAMNVAIQAARDAVTRGSWTIGQFFDQGVALGLANNQGFISSAAVAATRNAMHEAQANAQIHSPSQLWARELGMPLVQGIAAGISGGAHHVARAAVAAVQPGSLGGANGGMAVMGAGAGGGMAAGPTSVAVHQNFYGQTADHAAMLSDAAWAARSKLGRAIAR